MFFPHTWFVAPFNSRSTAILPVQLAQNNIWPMGDSTGEGLQTTADINPISEVPTKTPGNQEPSLNRQEDTETRDQGCSEEGPLYGSYLKI